MEKHGSGVRGLERGRGVGTFALVGAKSQAVPPFGGEPVAGSPDGQAAFFSLPSGAVRAAVEAVAKSPRLRYGAIYTGEFDPESLNVVVSRLEAIAAIGQPGQVVVSLAAHELARGSLPAEYEFAELGSVDLGGGQVERLFLCSHPSLRAPSNLPVGSQRTRRQTAFLGRSRELEELRRQIDLSRIVSVVGATGIGKSAILQRLVADLEGEFPDGLSVVDLSLLSQPALVEPTIVRIVGAPKLPGEDNLDALIAYLRHRRCLLVLDNAEGLINEVRRVASALADACPEVAILVGSQRSMRIAGEARFTLEGLETPTFAEDWRTIQDYDAVALFVDRAQLVDPKFRLAESNAAAVALLCQRLDGIPLAIELAAAKTQILSPRQILDRLDDRFLLLKDADSTRPDRQRTLQTMVDWGHSHLRQEARILLRRLSVFAGAMTVDQASQVCADSTLPEELVLPAFEELVENSMLSVSRVRSPEKRFYLSETIRIYARQRLRESGEQVTFQNRHREWCLRLSEEAMEGLGGMGQLEWLDRLDASYEDIRGAIERNLSPKGDGAAAVRMLVSIYQYFYLRHYLAEGLRLASKVVRSPYAQSAPDLARAFNVAALMAFPLGEREDAREYTLCSILTARMAGDLSGVARARTSLAFQYEDAGQLRRARRHFLKAAEVFRSLGEQARLLRLLVNLAGLEPTLGMVEEAEAHLSEAEVLLRKFPEPMVQAFFHHNSSHTALVAHRPRLVLMHAREAFQFFSNAQELNSLAATLRNIAYACEMIGDYDMSTRFAGAAHATANRSERQMRSYEEDKFEDLCSRLEGQVGHEEYRNLFFEGSQWDIDEISAIIVSIT